MLRHVTREISLRDHTKTAAITLWKHGKRFSPRRSNTAHAHPSVYILGFAVVLLVIYYLQKGCSPPVLPSLQSTDPIHFSTSSSVSVIADKLTSCSLPPAVTSYKSSNTQTLGSLLAGFFSFYCEFGWYQVLSVRLASTKTVPFDKKWTRPYIRIEDPCDQKNVTRAVYKLDEFNAIKQAFQKAKQNLVYVHSRLEDIL